MTFYAVQQGVKYENHNAAEIGTRYFIPGLGLFATPVFAIPQTYDYTQTYSNGWVFTADLSIDQAAGQFSLIGSGLLYDNTNTLIDTTWSNDLWWGVVNEAQHTYAPGKLIDWTSSSVFQYNMIALDAVSLLPVIDPVFFPSENRFANVGYAYSTWSPEAASLGRVVSATLTPSGVPEPATIALMGLGFAGMGYIQRRRKSV